MYIERSKKHRLESPLRSKAIFVYIRARGWKTGYYNFQQPIRQKSPLFDGLPFFLNYSAPRGAKGARGAPLIPSFKPIYLSFLCLVLMIVIVPGLHIVPSMMIHSLFFLSNTLISGLFAPFIGHLSNFQGMSHKIFASLFSWLGCG